LGFHHPRKKEKREEKGKREERGMRGLHLKAVELLKERKKEKHIA